MPVPFGFGIGDFLAVGDLVRRVAGALNDSRGSTAEYKSLSELLLSLNSSIHAASAIFFSSNTGGLSTIALLNGVRYELECCKRLLDEFLRNSREYTESLLTVPQGRRFRDEWRKITWSLFKDEDVKRLQGNLQGHIAAFQMYTFAITWQGLVRTEQKVIESSETNKRIEITVLEMFTFLKNLHDKLPKTLGYTWEGACTSDQKPVYLEDALGRTVFVPLVLCRNKSGFHDVLEIMFRDLPGHKRIAQKEYEVIDEAKEDIITDVRWESMVLPGVRIAISILVEVLSRASGSGAQKCPRCNASSTRAASKKSSLKCAICSLIFRTVDIERIVELPEPPPESDTLNIRQNPTFLRPTSSKLTTGAGPTSPQTTSRKSQDEEARAREKVVAQDKEAIERYLFRRIHFQREILKYLDRSQTQQVATRRRYEARYITNLQAAAGEGNLAMVQRLASNSADINAGPFEYRGRTALQAAAEGGHLHIVELLLSRSADVNADSAKYYGKTALQAAAGGGHLDIVELLLSRSADVNADPSHENGRTALQAAAEGGHRDIVEFLLSRSANVNAGTSYGNGRTALQAAAERGHLDIVELLLSRSADVNTGPSEYGGRTALQAAASGGHLDIVEFLLSRSADVNADPSRGNGRTALQAAAERGHLDIVELLLSRSADVNTGPSRGNGRTALQAAAERGHLDIVELLLSRSADVNTGPSEYGGRTALQAAASGGHRDIVELLLSRSANVNADPSPLHGMTALQAAAEGGHLDITKLLLSHGANVDAVGTASAFEKAREKGYFNFAEPAYRHGVH